MPEEMIQGLFDKMEASHSTEMAKINESVESLAAQVKRPWWKRLGG